LTSNDVLRVRAAYLAMHVTGWFVIVPLSFASPLTGFVQSLGSTWGLFRYYCVLIKSLITIPATLLLCLHMPPGIWHVLSRKQPCLQVISRWAADTTSRGCWCGAVGVARGHHAVDLQAVGHDSVRAA
jgi:hypothetical protein